MSPDRILRRLFEGPVRVWLFIGIVALASATVWAIDLRAFAARPMIDNVSLTWWELAVAFYLAEVFVVHLHFRKQAHTLSLSEIGLTLGLFFASPATLLIAHVAGATTALVVNRRQRPIKLAFNVAELPLCTGVALLVFRSFVQPGSSGPREWTIALLAAAVAHVIGVGLVSTVIAVAERRLSAPQLSRTVVTSLVGALATACLGLASVELLENEPSAFLLLVVPVVACGFAFRGYMEQREQREHVEFLYESMRATQGAPEFGLAVGQLLVAARRLLRAEYAEILLVSPTTAGPAVRSVSGPDGELLMHAEDELSPSDRLAMSEVGATDRAALLSRRRDPHILDGLLVSRSLSDAVVGALHGESGPFGLLIVGERTGDVGTFGESDRDLFETFAGHASILIENGRLEHSLAEVTELKEQLRHQAYHDSLTGLPNRVHFVETIAERLAGASEATQLAVLYVDLDGFKSVNDSWGHHTGDELLAQVADRIRHAVRAGDLPARLGGDEFAVLLDGADTETAERAAQRLDDTLAGTFSLASGEATVHASIGIALTGPNAFTAEDLIRNADLAMYSAKRVERQRYALYEPGLHGRLREQRRLALDLEFAVERKEIEVVYQPIVSLEHGRLEAFEALVRWRHPTRGLLMPSDFLEAAEANGLIVDIGMNVIEQAFTAARRWDDGEQGRGIGLWINLAPAELANERLIEDVAIALARAHVDADRVTIEITESSLIRNEASALAAMHGLRDLGIHLSIDDFGTGYSSLSRLGEFPIEMLKIPKPFVTRLISEDPDEPFVKAILGLSESLGLLTVGEGIEHIAQLRRLQQLGCNLGQGYLFSAALSDDQALDLAGDRERFDELVSATEIGRYRLEDATTVGRLVPADAAEAEDGRFRRSTLTRLR
jgi:diguanylate cyclase (GGDEF)-like protein